MDTFVADILLLSILWSLFLPAEEFALYLLAIY